MHTVYMASVRRSFGDLDRGVGQAEGEGCEDDDDTQREAVTLSHLPPDIE